MGIDGIVGSENIKMEVVISVVLACYDTINHRSREAYLQKKIEMSICPENGDIVILENGLETKVKIKMFDFEDQLINIKLEPIFFRGEDMEECRRNIRELEERGW